MFLCVLLWIIPFQRAQPEEELAVAGGAEERRRGDAANPQPVIDAPPGDAADHRRVYERIAHDAAAADLFAPRLELRLDECDDVRARPRDVYHRRQEFRQRDE